MRAILAEGRAAVRKSLRVVVEAHFHDCSIHEAGSLTETLRAMVEHYPVTVAVLDLGLAGMNGFQGLVAMRRLFPETRCIVLSAADGVAAEARRLGAHAAIPAARAADLLPVALARAAAGTPFDPPPGPANLQDRLTPRQRDIMRLLSEGLPNKVIANRLAVSEVTVKSHLGKVFRKLGVHNRLQAMRIMVDGES